MARRFALLSFGVLCLSLSALIGFHIGSQTVQAQVRTTDISGIVAIEGDYSLDDLGQVWEVRRQGCDVLCWERSPLYDPPVPVNDIKLWQLRMVITTDNVAWRFTYDGCGVLWINCGPWPGGAVPTDGQTWGGVKGKYENRQ